MVTFIIESCNSGEGPCTFRLAESVSLYKQRVEQLVRDDNITVNSTRLKEQLLLTFPELEAYHQYVLLAFHRDIAMFMEQASKTSEAVQLSKAASLLRKDMLSHKWNFDNTNSNQPTDQSVPPSLLEFVSMIEHGAENGALKAGLPWHSYCSLIPLENTKKEPNPTGIRNLVGRQLLFTWTFCLCKNQKKTAHRHAL